MCQVVLVNHCFESKANTIFLLENLMTSPQLVNYVMDSESLYICGNVMLEMKKAQSRGGALRVLANMLEHCTD